MRSEDAPQSFAAVRNTALDLRRGAGRERIASATRYFAAKASEALALLGLRPEPNEKTLGLAWSQTERGNAASTASASSGGGCPRSGSGGMFGRVSSARRRIALASAFAAAWALLRLALLAAGGDPGRAADLTVGGRRVAALVFRDEAAPARTLLVVAHGGLASKETLLNVCWEARRRGADCVAVDALGHGASAPRPPGQIIAAMRASLRADLALGRYEAVRFLGHSMGAYLGCGAVFPCEHSVSLGQAVNCPPDRIVWGTVHRALGLPDAFYLPVSHVLESWTPSAVDEALDRVLGPAPGARARIGLTVALAWTSCASMVGLGLVAAAALRTSARLPPAARGLAAAAAVWGALALGAWRALWFLPPTQASDAVLIGPTVAAALAAAATLRALGRRGAFAGVGIAAFVAGAASAVAFVAYPHRELAGLVALLPALNVPLAFAVAAGERVTRPRGADAVEGAAFAAALLATCQALLLPAW